MLYSAESVAPGNIQLCSVAAAVMKLDGAGIGLRNDDQQITTLCASTPAVRSIMDLESIAGEGPCREAFDSDVVIDEGYLDSFANTRWPIYTPLARDAGVRAVFGFPIRIGAIRLGALFVYRDQTGAMTPTQSSDGHFMASIIARAVLAIQAGASNDQLAQELTRAATFDLVIQQAAGMVAVQGLMSVADALVTLRAHGFATGMSTTTLAARIVAREVQFDPAEGYWVEALSDEPPFD